MGKMKELVVNELPDCDFPVCPNKAVYDAKTQDGPWAYMCTKCFERHGVGLGMGLGQKLVEDKKYG